MTSEEVAAVFKHKPIVDPDYSVLKKHKLLHHGGTPIKPFYIGSSVVWACSHRGEDEPHYAFYTCGTNCLKILKELHGEWQEVQLTEVENLYGIIWKIGIGIHE